METRIIASQNYVEEGIYLLSNENLSSYRNLFNFQNSDVLSVVGSGDQYFSSLLYGAKSIDLFDINLYAIYYFVLKFEAIKHLSYEEFIKHFLNYDNGTELFSKLSDFLPKNTKEFFKRFFSAGNSLKYLACFYNSDKIDLRDGNFIPYFKESEYYRLQNMLKNIQYPRIYLYNILSLFSMLDKNYDIMLFSNIEDHLAKNIVECYEILKEKAFPHLKDGGIIQANYYWYHYITNSSYQIDEVQSLHGGNGSQSDYVLSLRK